MALSRFDERFPVAAPPAASSGAPVTPWALTSPRLMLLVACVAAALIAPWWSGGGDELAVRDPQLATLLRFLGVVKLGLALLVGAGVWWRFGAACAPVQAVAYAGGVALMVMASLLILMLSRLPQAAACYHGAAFAMFALTLQDKGVGAMLMRRLRRQS